MRVTPRISESTRSLTFILRRATGEILRLKPEELRQRIVDRRWTLEGRPPTLDEGRAGDWWLDWTTGVYYERTEGQWVEQGTLEGLVTDQRPGAPGLIWHASAEEPTDLVEEGDYWLRVPGGDVYYRQDGRWQWWLNVFGAPEGFMQPSAPAAYAGGASLSKLVTFDAEGIARLSATALASPNWDGRLDALGQVASTGTKGWALTASGSLVANLSYLSGTVIEGTVVRQETGEVERLSVSQWLKIGGDGRFEPSGAGFVWLRTGDGVSDGHLRVGSLLLSEQLGLKAPSGSDWTIRVSADDQLLLNTGGVADWRIWHEGNDGAGSGLDADLLDGRESSTDAASDTVAVRDWQGSLSAYQFHSIAPQGVPPLSVQSATLVTNLNADYLRGLWPTSEATPQTVVSRDENADAELHRLTLTETTGAPLVVYSQARVDNLNADLLDDRHGYEYAVKALDEVITGRWRFDQLTRFEAMAYGGFAPSSRYATGYAHNLLFAADRRFTVTETGAVKAGSQISRLFNEQHDEVILGAGWSPWSVEISGLPGVAVADRGWIFWAAASGGPKAFTIEVMSGGQWETVASETNWSYPFYAAKVTGPKTVSRIRLTVTESQSGDGTLHLSQLGFIHPQASARAVGVAGDWLVGGRLGVGTYSPSYELDLVGSMRITGDLIQQVPTSGETYLQSSDFVSRLTGWRISSSGNADFRSVYADELIVQAFTADVAQALVGSEIITKSRAILAESFSVPPEGQQGTIIVEDIDGVPGMPAFSVGDTLRLRVVDRSGGGLVVLDVWARADADVTSTVNPGSGKQAWQVTILDRGRLGPDYYTSGVKEGGDPDAQPYAGTLVVQKGTAILDYGQPGDAVIYATVLDSASPYLRMFTWHDQDGDGIPDSYTLLVQLGNLSGITYAGRSLNGHGLFGENVYLTGAIRHTGGKWELLDDGSGRLASGKIRWDVSGNLTIENATLSAVSGFQNFSDYPSFLKGPSQNGGQAGLYASAEGLGYYDGASWTTVINQDGSGLLAGGAINWDASGNLTIEESAVVKGRLHVGSKPIHRIVARASEAGEALVRLDASDVASVTTGQGLLLVVIAAGGTVRHSQFYDNTQTSSLVNVLQGSATLADGGSINTTDVVIVASRSLWRLTQSLRSLLEDFGADLRIYEAQTGPGQQYNVPDPIVLIGQKGLGAGQGLQALVPQGSAQSEAEVVAFYHSGRVTGAASGGSLTVSGNVLVDGSITADKIKAGSITTAQLAFAPLTQDDPATVIQTINNGTGLRIQADLLEIVSYGRALNASPRFESQYDWYVESGQATFTTQGARSLVHNATGSTLELRARRLIRLEAGDPVRLRVRARKVGATSPITELQAGFQVELRAWTGLDTQQPYVLLTPETAAEYRQDGDWVEITIPYLTTEPYFVAPAIRVTDSTATYECALVALEERVPASMLVDSITLSQLNFTPLISAGGAGDIIATINASQESLRISADRIEISGTTVFTDGSTQSTLEAYVQGAASAAESGAKAYAEELDAAAKDAVAFYLGYGTQQSGAWDVMVADAQSGQTIIKGGYLNTELIEADAILTRKLAILANPNLLRDSSFEYFNESQTWRMQPGSASGRFSATWGVDRSFAYHGLQSLRVDVSVGSGSTGKVVLFVSDKVPVKGGQTYSVSAWVATDRGGLSPSGFKFSILEYRSNDTLIREQLLVDADAQAFTVGQWQHLAVSGLTVDANAAYVKVGLVFDGAMPQGSAFTVWVDAVKFERGGRVTTYSPNPFELAPGQVSGIVLEDGSIAAEKIQAGSITTSHLAFTPLTSAGGTGDIIATINASTEGISIRTDRLELASHSQLVADPDGTRKGWGSAAGLAQHSTWSITQEGPYGRSTLKCAPAGDATQDKVIEGRLLRASLPDDRISGEEASYLVEMKVKVTSTAQPNLKLVLVERRRDGSIVELESTTSPNDPLYLEDPNSLVADDQWHVVRFIYTPSTHPSNASLHADELLGIKLKVYGGLTTGAIFVTDITMRPRIGARLIVRGSIQAEHISVVDLSALGATIGGWEIDSNRIYKESAGYTIEWRVPQSASDAFLLVSDLSGDIIQLQAHGGGFLAKGKISWDETGKAFFTGDVFANNFQVISKPPDNNASRFGIQLHDVDFNSNQWWIIFGEDYVDGGYDFGHSLVYNREGTNMWRLTSGWPFFNADETYDASQINPSTGKINMPRIWASGTAWGAVDWTQNTSTWTFADYRSWWESWDPSKNTKLENLASVMLNTWPPLAALDVASVPVSPSHLGSQPFTSWSRADRLWFFAHLILRDIEGLPRFISGVEYKAGSRSPWIETTHELKINTAWKRAVRFGGDVILGNSDASRVIQLGSTASGVAPGTIIYVNGQFFGYSGTYGWVSLDAGGVSGGASGNADMLDGYDSTAFAIKANNELISGTWTFSNPVEVGAPVSGLHAVRAGRKILAGAGLTGGGDLLQDRTISHADTSSQASVTNTGGMVIQSVGLDEFGHVTSLSSINLDARYASKAGDIFTGDVRFTISALKTSAGLKWEGVSDFYEIRAEETGGSQATRLKIRWGDDSTDHVLFQHYIYADQDYDVLKLTKDRVDIYPALYAAAVYPRADAAYDLGSGTLRWRDLRLSGNVYAGGVLLGDGSASTPALRFASDTNTGLFRAAADEMRLVTAGSARVTIKSDGKVGIGTTTPSEQLHVAQSLLVGENIRLGNSSNGFLLYSRSGNSQDYLSITYRTGSTDQLGHALTLRRTASGNSQPGYWGVHTTTPEAVFHVAGTFRAGGVATFEEDLTSPNYQSGWGASGQGWKLTADGSLDVATLTVRKAMRVYELLIQQIRATNGSVAVSDSARVQITSYSGTSGTATIVGDGTLPFLAASATTNILVNPGFETGDKTGWTSNDEGVYQTTEVVPSSTGIDGAFTGRITVLQSKGHLRLHNYSLIQTVTGVGDNGAWTFSAYLRAPAGTPIGLRLVRLVGGSPQWDGGSSADVSVSTTATGKWQRLSVTLSAWTGAGSTDGFQVRAGIETNTLTVGTTCEVDAAQLEAGTTATPYVAGSRTEAKDIVIYQRFSHDQETGTYGIERAVLRIDSVSSDGKTITFTKLDGTDPAVGEEYDLVRIGNTGDPRRQGLLYLTATDEGAPYLDVIDGVNSLSSWDSASKLKARLGRLDGITYNGRVLRGYGLYAENVYLTGAVRNAAGKWSLLDDGSGQLASGRISWDADGTMTVGSWVIESERIRDAANRLELDLDGGYPQLKVAPSSVNTNGNDYVRLYYHSDAAWGLEGKQSNAVVFSLGEPDNRIAGWKFDASKLYTNNLELIGGSAPAIRLTKDASNYIELRYTGTSNWGIKGVYAGKTYFQLGSDSKIGGWTFDDQKLTGGNIELNAATGTIKHTGGHWSLAGDGTVIIGQTGGQHIQWNPRTGTLTVKGAIQVTSGKSDLSVLVWATRERVTNGSYSGTPIQLKVWTFKSPIVGRALIRTRINDPESGVYFKLNGTSLPAFDRSEIGIPDGATGWFEREVTLQAGTNTLEVWQTSSDGFTVYQVEIWGSPTGLVAAEDASGDFGGLITAERIQVEDLYALNATIGGWTIDQSFLAAQNIRLYSGSNARLEVGTGSNIAGLITGGSGSDVVLWAGSTHSTRSNAPFQVTLDGTLKATKGTVGGWTLGATSLSSDSVQLIASGAASRLQVGTGVLAAGIASGSQADSVVLWAGSDYANRRSAPFRVTLGGDVYAESITLVGPTIQQATITTTGDLTPNTDRGGDLGTTSKRWGNVRAGYSVFTNDAVVIGSQSRRTSGAGLELYGSTSSAILSVHDGNGRIQLKWNATRGTSETFLVGGENAAMWEFDPAAPTSDLLRISYASGSGRNAGDNISWQTVLSVGTTTFQYNGNTIWHAGNDGSGSGLDADLLDGQDGSYYRNASNLNAGNLNIARMPTGGNWSLSSNLTIDTSTLAIDITNDRVGIGTTSPAAALHISRQSGDLLYLQATGGGAGNTGSIVFKTYSSPSGANNPGAKISFIDDGNFSAHIAVLTKTPGADSNSLVERMRLTSTGNVGIGTTSPVYKLDVAGTARISDTLYLTKGLSAATELINLQQGYAIYSDNTSAHAASGTRLWFDAPNAGEIVLGPRAEANRLDMLRLRSRKVWVDGGSLGIGTSSPAYTLDVAGIAQVHALRLRIVDSGHIDTDGAFYRTGGQVYITVDDNLYIRDAGVGTKFHFDADSGRLGVNKTSPSYTLDVAGTGRFTGDLRTESILYAHQVRPTSGYWWIHPTNPNSFSVRASNMLAFRSPMKVERWDGTQWVDITSSFDWRRITSDIHDVYDTGVKSSAGETVEEKLRFTYDLDGSKWGAVIARVDLQHVNNAGVLIERSDDAQSWSTYIDTGIIPDSAWDASFELPISNSGSNRYQRITVTLRTSQTTHTIKLRHLGLYYIGSISYAPESAWVHGWDVDRNIELRSDGSTGKPALTWESDTNTGIYHPSADTLGLVTAGAERLRISSGGDVGIGTDNPRNVNTNPSYVLSVQTGDRVLTVSSASGAGVLNLEYNKALTVGDRIGLLAFSTAQGQSDAHRQVAGIASYIESLYTSNIARADLRFYVKSNAAAYEAMRIDSAGRLGIGTTSPAYKLDVAGTARISDTLYLTKGLSAATELINLQQGYAIYSDNTSAHAASGTRLWFDAPNAGEIVLGPRVGANLLDMLRLRSRKVWVDGGSLGIGTSSPEYNLDVAGNGRFATDLIVNGSLTATSHFWFMGADLRMRRYGSGDTVWKRALVAWPDRLDINYGTDFTRVSIQGYVGIRRIPNYPFHVSGTSLFDNDVMLEYGDGSGAMLSTSSFASGFFGHGWRITARGEATFESLTVRGTLRVYELLLEQIRATNGNLIVSDAARLRVTSVSGSTVTLSAVEADSDRFIPFTAGDLILAQRFSWNRSAQRYDVVLRIKGTVQSVNNTNKPYTCTITLESDSTVPAVGSEYDFVRVGSSNAGRQGLLYLAASDQDAPFLDVVDGIASWSNWYNTQKVKLRLGKLNGITDEDFGGALSDYGLYANNVYLKGRIVITGGSGIANLSDAGALATKNQANLDTDVVDGSTYKRTTANEKTGASRAYTALDSSGHLVTAVKPGATIATPPGAGLYMDSQYMGYYSGGAWKVFIKNNGQFRFEGNASQYIAWDGTTLSVLGTVKHAGGVWELNKNGNGHLANGSISWTSNGTLTISRYNYEYGEYGVATVYHGRWGHTDGSTSLNKWIKLAAFATGGSAWRGWRMQAFIDTRYADGDYTPQELFVDVSTGGNGRPIMAYATLLSLYNGTGLLSEVKVIESATNTYEVWGKIGMAWGHYCPVTIRIWTNTTTLEVTTDHYNGTDTEPTSSTFSISSTSNSRTPKALDEVATKLGYTSWSNMVTEAVQNGKTIIQGGYLNTSLIKARSIVASQLAITDFSDVKNASGGDSKISGWVLKPNYIQSLGGEITLDSSQKLIKVTGSSGYVQMFHSGTTWGLKGVSGTSTVFELGSTNKIAGWTFDSSAFYSGNIRIEAAGAIRHTGGLWELKNDGSGKLAGGTITWTNAGALTISGYATTGYADSKAATAEQQAKDQLAQKLGFSSYANMITAADQTFISGGYLNTNLIQARSIVASQLAITDFSDVKNASGGDSKISGWVLKPGRIQSLDGEIILDSSQLLIKVTGSTGYVQMHYSGSGNWGLRGVSGTSTVFELGSTNRIAGWTIGSTRLYNGTAIVLDAQNQRITVNGDGSYSSLANGIFLGMDGGAPKFRLRDKLTFDGDTLTVTGTINASAGNIAGWSLSSAQLSSGNIRLISGSNARIEIGATSPIIAGIAAGSSSSDVVFWAGNSYSSRNTAPFRVTLGGSLTATSGTIAGWTIGSSKLYNGTGIVLDSSNRRITINGDGSYASLSNGIFLGMDGGAPKFRLRDKLTFDGSTLTVSGVINATSGTIGPMSVVNSGQIKLAKGSQEINLFNNPSTNPSLTFYDGNNGGTRTIITIDPAGWWVYSRTVNAGSSSSTTGTTISRSWVVNDSLFYKYKHYKLLSLKFRVHVPANSGLHYVTVTKVELIGLKGAISTVVGTAYPGTLISVPAGQTTEYLIDLSAWEMVVSTHPSYYDRIQVNVYVDNSAPTGGYYMLTDITFEEQTMATVVGRDGIIVNADNARLIAAGNTVRIAGTFELVGPRGKIIFDSNEIKYSGSQPAGDWYYIEIKDSRGQVYKLLAKK